MDKKTRFLYTCLFSSLILLILAGNSLWITHGHPPAGQDVSHHLLFSLEFFHRLAAVLRGMPGDVLQGVSSLLRLVFFETMRFSAPVYPNLAYLATSAAYAVGGTSLGAARAANHVFLLILLSATLRLGTRVTSSLTGGLLSAFFLLAYPLVFQGARQFGLDLPVTAMTALCILLLVESDTFRKRPASILFGTCMGAGMLIKYQFPVYILGPLTIVAARLAVSLARDRAAGLRAGTNFLLAAVLAGTLGLPWLVHHRRDISRFMLHSYTRVSVDRFDADAFRTGLRRRQETGRLRTVDRLFMERLDIGDAQEADTLSDARISVAFNELIGDPRLLGRIAPATPRRRATDLRSAILKNLTAVRPLYPRETRDCTIYDPCSEEAGGVLLSLALKVKNLAFFGTGIPMLLAFLTAVPFFLRGPFRDKAVMAVWTVVPFLALSIASLLFVRHYMPLLPALAIMTAAPLAALRPPALRDLLLTASALLLSAQYWLVSFAPEGVRSRFIDYRILLQHSRLPDDWRSLPLFATSDFGPTPLPDDGEAVRLLARAIAASRHGKDTLLSTLGTHDAFYLRFLFLAEYPDLELYDLCAHTSAVRGRLDKMDHVVFYLEKGVSPVWPDETLLRELLEKYTPPGLYASAVASGAKDELIAALSAARHRYVPGLRLESPGGFWVLYSRRNGDAQ